MQIVEPNDTAKVSEIHVSHGEVQRKGGCKFTGYSAEVRNLSDVQAAYIKVCRLNPSALHISCAFRIPGTDTAHLQSYEDDGEHGCGRTIFSILLEADIYYRAIYVVRYYGNKHLGAARFNMIKSAVKSSIAQASFNLIVKKHQYLSSDHEANQCGRKSSVNDTPTTAARMSPASEQMTQGAEPDLQKTFELSSDHSMVSLPQSFSVTNDWSTTDPPAEEWTESNSGAWNTSILQGHNKALHATTQSTRSCPGTSDRA